MILPTRVIARPRVCSRLLSPVSKYGRRHLTNNGFFRVSEEVREAIHSKKPVVALETTIYTHGRDSVQSRHDSIAN
jgi:pseudouridine-5'-phosphate glycosidase/pseudouridine kinase